MLMERLHSSPIEWGETERELELHLPSRGGRLIGQLLPGAVFFAPFVLFVVYASDGWLPAVIGMTAVPAILLYIAYAKMRADYLTDTRVTITTEQVIVVANRGGHARVKEFTLRPRSRAWQWTPRQATSGSPEPKPQGIVVADETYDSEAGGDPDDRSKARFGGNLTPGEIDWLEWRVNLFLYRDGRSVANAPNEPEEDTARQKGLVRIDEGQFGTRISFPNTVTTGSYTGIGSLFVGVVLLTICCAPLLIIWNGAERMSLPQLLLQVAYVGIFGLLGVAGTSNGLVQLFGRRRLTISPQWVEYSASVLGIGVWWTLHTAEIVSMWDPLKRIATRPPNKDMASAGGAVIRTARRELPLRAVQEAMRSGTDPQWLAEEICRHLVAARSQYVVGAARAADS
jgi:hypothetical protein